MAAYDGPIIDAHHHFWEPSRGFQPWLRPEAHIPFRYGDYESIKRDYLPPDLLADAAGFKIVGTVTMETEWVESDPVGEMRYTQGLQNRFGLPTAAVAHAVLNDPAVEETIEELAALPIVRSIRHKPGQAVSPALAADQPSLLTDAKWRKGYAAVLRHGLRFDLQVAWWHFHEAADLARTFPEQLIIINHAGLPADRSAEAMRGWRDAVRSMAALPNTVMKISGIGLPGVPWTAENNRIVVDTLVEAFGADRVLFASNFPVDSLCGSYADIFGGFVELSRDWSQDEQLDAFCRTAIRVYRLDPDLPHASRAQAGVTTLTPEDSTTEGKTHE